MSDVNLLKHFLETTFCFDGVVNWEDIQSILKDPKFPNREKTFKHDLANAISNKTLPIKEVERLTGLDFETQHEVEEFLKTQIWQPLYGDEPITLQQTA